MTAAAEDFAEVSEGLYSWQVYDSQVKADLFSTALQNGGGLVFVDPIPLAPPALAELVRDRTVSAILVTNANHARAAAHFAGKFSAPIMAQPVAAAATGLPGISAVKSGIKIAPDLRVIEIPGAAPGEIAIHCSKNGGTLIVGDALINFEPYGFTFLPAKYCTDFRKMRQSLRALLDFDFERMLFAHGTPLLTDARKRFEQLIKSK